MMMPSASDQLSFAVLDLESTGLFPGRHDRVLEVAVVRVRPDGSVEDEYATLVNPERDVGPVEVHGIHASDVVRAPTFAKIAGALADRLSGAVVVGHNLRFDLRFLEAEYARAGISMPAPPSLCTLALAYKVLPAIPSRRLADCCAEFGIELDDAHCALGDARATAALLIALLREAKERRIDAAPPLSGSMRQPLPVRWCPFTSTCEAFTREHARASLGEEHSYLSRLISGLRGDDTTSATVAEYESLLDRALLDRRVTSDEASLLIDTAREWGLSKADVRATHRRYMAALVREARRDGTVTPAETKDLSLVATLLGLSNSQLEAMLCAPIDASSPRPRQASSSLRGKSVCFTGELNGVLDGAAISRESAEQLARGAGLQVHPRVTKKLDFLVVADASSCSGKAVLARKYGITILAEMAFWRAIGVSVE